MKSVYWVKMCFFKFDKNDVLVQNQELEEKLKRIEDNHNKQSVVYEEIIEVCINHPSI